MDTWIEKNYPFGLRETLGHYDRIWNAYYIPGICCMIIGVLYLYWDSRKPKNFPPGPRWYPIVGCGVALAMARRRTGMLWRVIKEYAEKFDLQKRGIVGIKVGKDNIVVVYTSDSIKEMMTSEVMDGRPMGPFYETRTWNMRRGVLLTDSDFWTEQRRFIVRHLKEFGFARKGMADICQYESECMFEDVQKALRENGNQPVEMEFRCRFSVYILNTLWCMMTGKRYPKENPTINELQKILNDLFQSIDMCGALFSHFPVLRFIAPELSGFQPFLRVHERMYAFIKGEIESHMKVFDPNSEPTDLMDAYLKAMHEMETPSEGYTVRQLMAVCLDMFIAGSETTNKTLDFTMLHLVRNQDVQKKLQQEIDTVIGRSRLPALDDRANMPYAEAVILEGLRMFMGNTFGIPHRAMEDTELCGYSIPKDTMLIGSFYGMCFNPDIFPNPREFNPEAHFMREGKPCVPESYHPFGYGKRRCMGEKMARCNLFLLVTTLFQNFNVTPLPGAPIPTDEPIDGATPAVTPYKVQVSRR